MNSPRPSRSGLLGLLGSVLLSGGLSLTPAWGRTGPSGGFTFLQISDTHLEPLAFGAPLPKGVRGEETFRWLRRILARRPAGFFPFRPSFLVVTGDLTEFGFWGRTGEAAERTFSSLGLPWYAVCGNHDETWNPAAPFMRKRHGGRRYSFERKGCRFVVLPSSTIQDPLPTLDGGDLAWLRRDLAAGGRKKPVFLFFHHPPASGEFAQPAQLRLLMDALEGYPVVLLCFGHGHRPLHQRLFGWLDCVEGGTTFRKRGAGDFRGVNVITLKGGVLKVVYRFMEPPGRKRVLLEKRISLPPGPAEPFRLVEPPRGARVGGKRLDLLLSAPAPAPGKDPDLKVFLDGRESRPAWKAAGRGRWRCSLSLEGLEPGAHLVSLEGRGPGGRIRQRSRVFFLEGGPVKVLWRHIRPAGFKAGPLVLGEGRVILADLEGEVRALSLKDGKVLWTKKLPAEVVGSPAALGRGGVVVGCGDGKVYCLDKGGGVRWSFDAGSPLYGPPLAASGRVYIGDGAGVLHALDAAAGREVWRFRRAGYGIESRPALWAGLVLFTAWDGRIYALDGKTGRLRWKAFGPRASRGAARYYAPADCGPVPAGRWCYLCDRGYLLGRYDRKGRRDGWTLKGVPALARGGGGFLNVRTLSGGVWRLDREGKILWKAPVPAGRIPLPPRERDGRVFSVSDRGVVAALEARTGRLLGRYRATPGLYVMAPLGLGPGGVCVVAGIGGTVTALQFP